VGVLEMKPKIKEKWNNTFKIKLSELVEEKIIGNVTTLKVKRYGIVIENKQGIVATNFEANNKGIEELLELIKEECL
jgi:hypothetical protein